jgi:tetratricopeptide (TPR) repeat protein
LASIYYEQGNLDMAIFHYKQAISLDSEFLEAYNNLVGHFVSYHSGFFTVNWYFLLPPSSLNLDRCFFFFFLLFYKGNALKDSGRVEDAIQCYRVGSFYPCFLVCFLLVSSHASHMMLIIPVLFSEAMSCPAS